MNKFEYAKFSLRHSFESRSRERHITIIKEYQHS